MTKRDEKIQGYMLKSLLTDPERACYWEYEENSVAVTWNGFQIYVLPKKDICFALDKCGRFGKLGALLTMVADDNELTPTDTLKQLGKGYGRKLKAKDFDIWVNDKHLKDFGEVKYYAFNSLGRILVTDTETDEIIGCILPVKVEGES